MTISSACCVLSEGKQGGCPGGRQAADDLVLMTDGYS